MPHDYIDTDSPRRQLQSGRDRYNNQLTQKNTTHGQCLLLDGHVNVE